MVGQSGKVPGPKGHEPGILSFSHAATVNCPIAVTPWRWFRKTDIGVFAGVWAGPYSMQ